MAYGTTTVYLRGKQIIGQKARGYKGKASWPKVPHIITEGTAEVGDWQGSKRVLPYSLPPRRCFLSWAEWPSVPISTFSSLVISLRPRRLQRWLGLQKLFCLSWLCVAGVEKTQAHPSTNTNRTYSKPITAAVLILSRAVPPVSRKLDAELSAVFSADTPPWQAS